MKKCSSSIVLLWYPCLAAHCDLHLIQDRFTACFVYKSLQSHCDHSIWSYQYQQHLIIRYALPAQPMLLTIITFTLRYDEIQYYYHTLRRLKNGTLEVQFMFLLSFRKLGLGLTLNNSVISLSISIINVSFGILMTSRKKICPWSLNLMKK